MFSTYRKSLCWGDQNASTPTHKFPPFAFVPFQSCYDEHIYAVLVIVLHKSLLISKLLNANTGSASIIMCILTYSLWKTDQNMLNPNIQVLTIPVRRGR